jgi:predicted porin
MQKKIIALAVAGLVSGGAFAQSNVTISGLFDAGLTNSKIEGNTTSNTATYNNNGTSQITFAATEDLGGGMKAGMLAETDLRGAGAMAGFQHYVWIGGNFGTVSLGQRTNFTTTTAVTMQPFSTAMGGGYSTSFTRLRGGGFGAGGAFSSAVTGTFNNLPAAGTDLRDVRPNGVLDYRSPSFNGLTFGLQFKPKNNDATESVAASTANLTGYTNLGANYNNGPMNLSFAHSKASNKGGALSGNDFVKHSLIGGNYSFGPATIYAGWTRSKADTAAATSTDSQSWNIALKYQVAGNISLAANVLRDNDKLAANQDSNLTAIGADYDFSKRTNAYVRYQTGDYDKSAATGSGLGKFKGATIGLKHTF